MTAHHTRNKNMSGIKLRKALDDPLCNRHKKLMQTQQTEASKKGVYNHLVIVRYHGGYLPTRQMDAVFG